MPRKVWGIKGWVVALFMAMISAMALTEPQPMNLVSQMLPFLALTVMGAGFLHHTPVVLMFFILLLIPFTSYSTDIQIPIIGIGLAYLYFIWKKRHSVKDWLMASTTPDDKVEGQLLTS
jgi:hypothetical protein